MGDELASLFVKIGADLSGLHSAFAEAGQATAALGQKIKSVGKTLSVAVTAPIVALGAASVAAFDTQAKAVAGVETRLRRFGAQAGTMLEKLKADASALQSTSLFGDEEILSGVTQQLLTFGSISGPVFDRAQQAALDLSTTLGQSLQSSAIQLGKALNDPIKGVAALGRVGIQFSESQKATIKTMQESGDLLGAQNLILKEVETFYGGAAAAAAAAGSGGFTQAKMALGDALEVIGKVVVEGLAPLAKMVKEAAEAFQRINPETLKVAVAIAGVAAAVGPLLVGLGALLTIAPQIAVAWDLILGPTALVVAGVVTAVAAYDSYVRSAREAVAENAKLATSTQQTAAELPTLIEFLKRSANGWGNIARQLDIVTLQGQVFASSIRESVASALAGILEPFARMSEGVSSAVYSLREFQAASHLDLSDARGQIDSLRRSAELATHALSAGERAFFERIRGRGAATTLPPGGGGSPPPPPPAPPRTPTAQPEAVVTAVSAADSLARRLREIAADADASLRGIATSVTDGFRSGIEAAAAGAAALRSAYEQAVSAADGAATSVSDRLAGRAREAVAALGDLATGLGRYDAIASRPTKPVPLPAAVVRGTDAALLPTDTPDLRALDAVRESVDGLARAIGDGLGTALDSLLSGRSVIASLGDAFEALRQGVARVMASVVADIGTAIARALILRALTSAFGGGGLIGGALASLTGGAGKAGPLQIALTGQLQGGEMRLSTGYLLAGVRAELQAEQRRGDGDGTLFGGGS